MKAFGFFNFLSPTFPPSLISIDALILMGLWHTNNFVKFSNAVVLSDPEPPI